MSEPTRYEPGMSYDPQPDGDYVLYTDYATLRSQLDELCDAVDGFKSAVTMKVTLNHKRAMEKQRRMDAARDKLFTLAAKHHTGQ